MLGLLGTGQAYETIMPDGYFNIGTSYTIINIGTTINTQWNIIGGTTNVIYYTGMTFVAFNTGNGVGNGNAYVTDAMIASIIPANYGQCNDIEVFIGGYNTSTWTPSINYNIGDIVVFGSYTYKCILSHQSETIFDTSITTITTNPDTTTIVTIWTLFIDNIRLKKNPYTVFDVNKAPYSPAGDIKFVADFSVDGTTKQIRLTNAVPVGTRVTVVKQYGSTWNNKYAIL